MKPLDIIYIISLCKNVCLKTYYISKKRICSCNEQLKEKKLEEI